MVTICNAFNFLTSAFFDARNKALKIDSGNKIKPKIKQIIANKI